MIQNCCRKELVQRRGHYSARGNRGTTVRTYRKTEEHGQIVVQLPTHKAERKKVKIALPEREWGRGRNWVRYRALLRHTEKGKGFFTQNTQANKGCRSKSKTKTF